MAISLCSLKVELQSIRPSSIFILHNLNNLL